MELIKQPNRASCLPASLAMVLGRSFDEIIKTIGHDGLFKQWPHLDEPFCYKGFGEPEMIEAAYRLGYAAIPIVLNYNITPWSRQDLQMNMFTTDEAEVRANEYMDGNLGIISGYVTPQKMHACAWDGCQVYDPMEPRIYSFDESGIEKISVATFYLIEKICK